MSAKGYEEMAEEWHNKVDEAIKHIRKARKLIGEIPPSMSTAISVWGEKGYVNKKGERVSLDMVSHAGNRGKYLVMYRLLQAILAELEEGRII